MTDRVGALPRFPQTLLFHVWGPPGFRVLLLPTDAAEAFLENITWGFRAFLAHRFSQPEVPGH